MMDNKISVIGWCDAYGTQYKQSEFTDEKRKALVERIRQREYNFTFSDHQYLPYCSPFYSDKTICVLTKKQFDSVMNEAYNEKDIGQRLIPLDELTEKPIENVLFEKQKYISTVFETNN